MAETQYSWQKHLALAGNLSRAACFHSSNTSSFHQEQQKIGEMCLIASGPCVSTILRQSCWILALKKRLLHSSSAPQHQPTQKQLAGTYLKLSCLFDTSGTNFGGSVIEKQKLVTELTLSLLITGLPVTPEK